MPEVHARLSASGAKAWLSCGGYIAFQDNYSSSEAEESEYAKEGTHAHEIAEKLLKRAFKLSNSTVKRAKEDADMLYYVDQYVDYVKRLYKGLVKQYGEAHIRIEQRVDFSNIVKDGFGTVDTLIICNNEMHIVDLKFGKGVAVSAYQNPQLQLYGLGALNEYDTLYDIETVVLHIVQIRLDNISVYEISVDELVEWGKGVKEAADKIYAGEIEYHPGIEQCRWCKGRAICKERYTQSFAPLLKIINDRITGDDL